MGQQLKQLGFLVQINEEQFAAALELDLGRPRSETLFGESAVMKATKLTSSITAMSTCPVTLQAHVNETHQGCAG